MSILFPVLYALEAILTSESYRISWKVLWLGFVIFTFRKSISWRAGGNVILTLMILRSLWFFVNAGALSGDVLEFRLGVKYLLMPLCFVAIPLMSSRRWQRSILLLLGLQLLWVFNLAGSGTNQFDLGALGNSFVGSFGVPHLASISLAFVFVYLLYTRVRYKPLLLTFTVILALWTWVRTGLLIIAVSLIFRYRKRLFQLRTILSVLALTACAYGVYNSLPTDVQLSIYNRLFDINYSGDQIAGSGRLIFFQNSLEVWGKEDLYALFFGGGSQPLASKNLADTGYSVYGHNEFLTMLSQNGLFGFTTIVMLTIVLFVHATRRNNEFLLAVLCGWTALNFVQGGIWFIPEILIATAYAQHSKRVQTT